MYFYISVLATITAISRRDYFQSEAISDLPRPLTLGGLLLTHSHTSLNRLAETPHNCAWEVACQWPQAYKHLHTQEFQSSGLWDKRALCHNVDLKLLSCLALTWSQCPQHVPSISKWSSNAWRKTLSANKCHFMTMHTLTWFRTTNLDTQLELKHFSFTLFIIIIHLKNNFNTGFIPPGI